MPSGGGTWMSRTDSRPDPSVVAHGFLDAAKAMNMTPEQYQDKLALLLKEIQRRAADGDGEAAEELQRLGLSIGSADHVSPGKTDNNHGHGSPPPP